jgi:hypothetical protein
LLGVAVARIIADGREIALEGAAFGPGWHALERSDWATWRWTTGCASLIVPPGTSRLELELQGTLPYRVPQTAAAAA